MKVSDLETDTEMIRLAISETIRALGFNPDDIDPSTGMSVFSVVLLKIDASVKGDRSRG